MATRHVLVCFILSMMTAAVICQTFQYSHGWTNGKRSMLEELVNSAGKNPHQLDNVLVDCELQKLRLLLQGNANSQLIQLPCELFFSAKRNLAESVDVEHFRRQPTPINNNY
ncbi:corazonin [Augochlora pura]